VSDHSRTERTSGILDTDVLLSTLLMTIN